MLTLLHVSKRTRCKVFHLQVMKLYRQMHEDAEFLGHPGIIAQVERLKDEPDRHIIDAQLIVAGIRSGELQVADLNKVTL